MESFLSLPSRVTFVKLVERRYNDVKTDFSCHERESRETRWDVRGTRETCSCEAHEYEVPHKSLVITSS